MDRFVCQTILFAFFLFSTSFLARAQVRDVLPQTVIIKVTTDAMRTNAFQNDATLIRELEKVQITERTPFFPDRYRTIKADNFTVNGRDKKIFEMEEGLSRIFILKYSASTSPFDVVSSLSKMPQIEYVEPFYAVYPLGPLGETKTAFTPDDSLFAQQAFLKTMKAEEAWEIEKGDSTVVIAVSDTGIDWAHPDLTPNIYINPGENGTDSQGRNKRTNGVDDDGNSKVDDWHGWDYVAGSNGSQQDNDTRGGSSHGTSVTGLIGAATNNRIGIASIGFRCKILPLKIGRDDGQGGLAISSDVFLYALARGAKAFNASWGSFGYQQSFQDLISYCTAQGMLIVGGAGNHGGTTPFYPASYKGVLGVGVSNANDVISSISGYGPTVDVMTPAEGALSVSPGGGYSAWGAATSASAPIGAGLAGLVKSHFPGFTADQVRERIRVTSDDIDAKNPTKTKFAAKGRVNALRAISDPPTPSIRIDSFAVYDPNNNRALDPGEQVGVAVWLKNYLAPTGQSISLTLVPVTNPGNITVNQATVTVNALGTNQIGDNTSNKMTCTVSTSNVYDATVLFRVDIKSGSYEDFDFLSVVVNPSYKTIRSNTFTLTIPADGSLGYRDFPINQQGIGMLAGTNNLFFYMGGLMIGTEASHVVDAVRSATDFFTRDQDFRMTQPTDLKTPGVRAASEAVANFDDGFAARNRKLNISVKMESFDYSNKDIKDIIFTKYSVKNDSSGTLNNLRIGLFMDLGGAQYYAGRAYADTGRYAGYVARGSFPVVGSFVIDSLLKSNPIHPIFWAMDNDPAAPGSPFGTYDGFTYNEKWVTLSSSSGRPLAGLATPNGDNVGYVISSRAFTLAPAASAEVVFGHFIATSYTAFTQQIDKAIDFWRGRLAVGVKDEKTETPDSYSLSQSYPNPFPINAGGAAQISFTLPYESHVRISVYNLPGQEVATIVNQRYTAGHHVASYQPIGLTPGVYSYCMYAVLRSNTIVLERKMVLLR